MVLALSDVVRYLLFPLAVLLTGAAVTGLLIPELTRRRDDYRKALEVKTGLVSEISQTVMDFMIAMQFAVVGAVSQEQKEYDEAYKTWEVRSAVLGTNLEAFFAHSQVPDDWETLEGHLRRLYGLTGIGDWVEREEQADAFLAEYGLRRSQSTADDRNHEAAWRNTWKRLSDAILERKATLILDVLGARVNGVEAPPLVERLASRTRAQSHDSDRG
jgi:hypothetical protein